MNVHRDAAGHQPRPALAADPRPALGRDRDAGAFGGLEHGAAGRGLDAPAGAREDDVDGAVGPPLVRRRDRGRHRVDVRARDEGLLTKRGLGHAERRREPPAPAEVVAELLWVVDRAEEHLGAERAERYLRKFYPWYTERLQAPARVAEELQRSADLGRARELIGGLAEPAAVA